MSVYFELTQSRVTEDTIIEMSVLNGELESSHIPANQNKKKGVDGKKYCLIQLKKQRIAMKNKSSVETFTPAVFCWLFLIALRSGKDNVFTWGILASKERRF